MDFLCDEYDRSIEEKAFYRKIEELQNAGYKIIKTMGKYSTYYLDLPRLTASEMLYLSIMILGSQDLSAQEASGLVAKLQAMPVHNLSNFSANEYKIKLKSNHLPTGQMKKFAIVFNAMKVHSKISFRENLSDNFDEFSSTKCGVPIDFSVADHTITFTIDEDGQYRNYLLKNMINVEKIF